MADKVKCEKVITCKDGTKHPDGGFRTWHEKCGEPASECVIGGELTTAKAILCETHKRMAMEEAAGLRNRKPKDPDPRQLTIPNEA